MMKYWLCFTLSFWGYISFCQTLPQEQKISIEKLITGNRFGEALSSLEALPDTTQKTTAVLILKGICFYNIPEHRSRAVPTLEEALTQSPGGNTDIDILYHLAQAHISNTDYELAIRSYQQLKQQIPAKFKTFHQKIDHKLAFCYARLNSPEAQAVAKHSFPATTQDSTNIPIEPSIPGKQYTIQICTMSFPLSDSFFKGQYGVKLIRMGDLYRYIYNIYDTLEEARNALPKIRKIYPDAFIREFDENKLGKAIDLQLDKLK